MCSQCLIAEDNKILENPDLSMRKRFAIIHRKSCKEILEANLNIFNILMRILARMAEGKPLKRSYMTSVKDEETED